MIKDYLKNYGGIILFYLAIIGVIYLFNFPNDYYDSKPITETYALSN